MENRALTGLVQRICEHHGVAITNTIPYLNFPGTAADAVAFYQDAFGAQVTSMMKFGDMENHPFGPEADDRVMHADLKLGEASIMLSDGPPSHDVPSQSNVHVSVAFDDLEEMRACWAKASDGGTVSMELAPAFWGATFGMFTDKFGIQWMFNGPGK